MSPRRLWLAGVALLAAACAVEEAATSRPGPESEPAQGGTAIVAQSQNFEAFNELVSQSASTNYVLDNILFMGLIDYDRELNYIPWLADSFWVSRDGMAITFRLREGVRWHDGTPVTVDDVAWTYEMSVSDEVGYPNRARFKYVDAVERVDDRTVRFLFNQAHGEPEHDFIWWSPMPKHLLKDVLPGQMRNAPFNRKPIGNGPFRFVSWQPNQEVVFEANDDFVFGRPYLDRIVFRVIPEETTLLTELLAGQVDLLPGVPFAGIERLEASKEARPIIYESNRYQYISYNTLNPLFADARVRRALTMAVDRDAIVDALMYGHGRVAVTHALPFQWEYNAALTPLPYDPDSARALLKNIGWVDTDGDGVLDNGGRPFRFTLLTNRGETLREDMAVIIQSDLAEVGIEVVPRSLEWTTFVEALWTKQFEAAVTGWSVDLKFEPWAMFSTDAIDGQFNDGSYSNPGLDAVMDRANRTLDRDEAKPLWDEVQEVLHDEQPYTFLVVNTGRLGVSNRLEGVEADVRGYLVSVRHWWIPEVDRQ